MPATLDRPRKQVKPLPPAERRRRDYAIRAAVEDGATFRGLAPIFGLTPAGILKAYRRTL